MKKYTPYAKLSKKQKRVLDQQKRVTWRFSPITRRPENPKAYQRKKARHWMIESSDVLFFISFIYLRRKRHDLILSLLHWDNLTEHNIPCIFIFIGTG